MHGTAIKHQLFSIRLASIKGGTLRANFNAMLTIIYYLEGLKSAQAMTGLT